MMMKKLLAILPAFYLLPVWSSAQSADSARSATPITYVHGHSNFVYGEMSLGGATHFMFNMLLNVMFDDNIVSSGYVFNSVIDPAMPSDYQRGLLEAFPRIRTKMLGVMYGRTVHFRHATTRFTYRGGIGMGSSSIPYSYTPHGGWFEGNYEYSRRDEITIGALVNPEFEFATSRGFGLNLGLMINVNSATRSAGVNFGMLFGKVRSRRSW